MTKQNRMLAALLTSSLWLSGCVASAEMPPSAPAANPVPDEQRSIGQSRSSIEQSQSEAIFEPTAPNDSFSRSDQPWLAADMPVIDDPVSRLQLEKWLDTIRSGLQEQPSVRAAQFFEAQTISTIEEAKAALRPRVSVGSSFNTGRSVRGEDEQALVAGLDPSSAVRLDPTLTINQILYDGGASTARVEAASARADQARNQRLSTEGGLALRRADSLIQLARLQEQLVVARDNLAELELIAEMTRSRVEAGRDSPSETLEMKGRVLEAQRQIAGLVGRRAEAGARYREIFNERPVVLAFPSVFAPIPVSYDAALGIAMRANPDVLASRATVKAAVADNQATQAEGLPRIEVEGRLAYFDTTRQYTDFYDQSVSINLTYDIYDGGLRKARQQGSLSQLDRAKAEDEQLIRSIRSALGRAYANRIGLIPEYRIVRGELDRDIATRNVYREQFVAGKKPLSDLITAQQQVFSAALQVSEIEANLHRQHFTILSLLGELSATKKDGCTPTATLTCRGDALADGRQTKSGF